MTKKGQNTILRLIKTKKRHIQDSLLQLRDNASECFVSPADINGKGEGISEKLWLTDDLRKILPGLSNPQLESILERFAFCLTILVWIEWPQSVGLEDFSVKFREHFHGNNNGISDELLPLNEDDQRIFRALGDKKAKEFLKDQYIFKPCIISDNTEELLHIDKRPLPFLNRPKRVGDGNFGTIYQANIAQGCFVNREGNRVGKLIAYKNIPHPGDFEEEKRVLTHLSGLSTPHEHIVKFLGSMVRLNEHYIFFEYTELGDLQTLFNGGYRPARAAASPTISNDDPQYRFASVFASPRPMHFVQQLSKLAGALDYLHNNLEDDTGEFVCAHMDIKPDNILVYHDRVPEGARPNIGKWVLADFGHAWFRRRSHAYGQQNTSYLATPEFESDYSRTERTMPGPFRAPELQFGYKRPDPTHYDEYAFGCIINEVFVFISEGIDKNADRSLSYLRSFRHDKERATRVNNSWFDFDPRGPRDFSKGFRSPNYPTLNSFVHKWLDERFKEGIVWKQKLCKIIRAAIAIDPEERATARKMKEDLLSVIRDLDSAQNSELSETSRGPRHDTESFNSNSGGRPSVSLTHQSDTRPTTASTQAHRPSLTGAFKEGTIKHPTPKAKNFAVAPDCSLVAYLYRIDKKHTVEIYKPDARIGMTPASKIRLPSENLEWKDISLGPGLLIARGKTVEKHEKSKTCVYNVQKANDPQMIFEGLHHDCSTIAGSHKVIVWVDKMESQKIRIWRGNTGTANSAQMKEPPTTKSFTGTIRHMCLNASATCLFVWERRRQENYVHVLDLTLPDIPAQSRSWARSGELACRLWPAQESKLCIVRETERSKRRILYFDDNITPDSPNAYVGEGSLKSGGWESAVSDNLLLTVRSERKPGDGAGLFSKAHPAVGLYRRRFEPSKPREGLVEIITAEEETRIAQPVMDEADFKVACVTTSDGFERIVVCGKSGKFLVHDTPVPT